MFAKEKMFHFVWSNMWVERKKGYIFLVEKYYLQDSQESEKRLSGAQVPASPHHSQVSQGTYLALPGTVQPQARWGRHSRLWALGMPGDTSAGTWHMERSLAMKESLIQDIHRNSELEE